jgi:CRP/FNR family transcriptional regulator, cyclic AMP receptor protein
MRAPEGRSRRHTDPKRPIASLCSRRTDGDADLKRLGMPAPRPVDPTTRTTATSAKAVARALLNRSLGLRDCRPDTLDALVAAGHVRHLGNAELFLSQGERFDMLCMVIEGSIEVSLTRYDGHRHLIGFLQPGDLAGLMCLIDGQGHVNNLRARQSATLLLVPGADVRRIREQDAALGCAFERQLVFRSRLLYERLSADPSVPLEARLARLLHLLIGLYGRTAEGVVTLDMKLSQTDLADWLGSSRQRINFIIRSFERDGLIQLSYARITITDPEGLAARSMR